MCEEWNIASFSMRTVPWRMKEMEFSIPTVCLRTSHDGPGLMMLRLRTWWDHKCIWPYLGLKYNIKLYTFLDVGEKKKHGSSEHYLFSVALGFVWCSCSNLSIICCHFAITKWQPNCMFQLSWPVHVQRVSEYFYYLLFFVAWFVIILFV